MLDAWKVATFLNSVPLIQILKDQYVVFGEEIETQNVYIYSINEGIIQTQKYSSFP